MRVKFGLLLRGKNVNHVFANKCSEKYLELRRNKLEILYATSNFVVYTGVLVFLG
jgi:hypothetical protein